jgi:phosphatidylglycerol---prolipoprotein diacylglyceryl transferase
MRPVLFTWRGAPVSSYAVMLYFGLVFGTFAAGASAQAQGLHANAVAVAILALLAPAVLGARLAFVAGHWSTFRADPRRIFGRRRSGAVAYGALLAVPASVPLLLALGIPFGSFWDAGAVGFLTATIFLRAGCLLNGCCSGRATRSRFGIVVRDHRGRRVRRIPTPVLEAISAAAILAGAAAAEGRMPFHGALFLSTLAAYATGRFAIDFTRDAPGRHGGLTVVQRLSASFVVLSLAAFIVTARVGG